MGLLRRSPQALGGATGRSNGTPLPSAHELFRHLARDRVGPLLRSFDFKGSVPNWRLSSPNGDSAIVNLQRSAWNGPEAVAFYVNVAIVPVPWAEWLDHASSTPAATVHPRASAGVWQRRVVSSAPGGLKERWEISDAASADRCAAELLPALTGVVPELQRLLDRTVLAATLIAGDIGLAQGPTDWARVALTLADQRGPELDQVLAQLDNGNERLHEVADWIRHRPAIGLHD